MKAPVSHRARSQKRTLLVVSAFALSMITLQVIDMISNSSSQSVSATTSVAHNLSAGSVMLSNFLPEVEVVAPMIRVTEPLESVVVEEWMMKTDTWLSNEESESTPMLETWMFDSNYQSQLMEESPELESWMYSSEDWFSTSHDDDFIDVENWMCDAGTWL